MKEVTNRDRKKFVKHAIANDPDKVAPDKGAMSRRTYLKVAGGVVAVAAIAGAGYWFATQGAAPTSATSTATPTVGPSITPTATAAQETVVEWSMPFVLPPNTDEQFYAPLVQAFEKENPDIHVDVHMIPWSGRDAAMLTAMAAGTAPDVAYINSLSLGKFCFAGALEPLDDYPEFKSNMLANYRPDVLSRVEWQDKLHYLVQVCMVPGNCFMYNTDIFKKAGISTPPDTWDDLIPVAQKATDLANKIYGTSFTGLADISIANYFIADVMQCGGDLTDEAITHSTFNQSPGGLDVVQFWYDLLNKYKVVPPNNATMGLSDQDAMFGQGTIASIFDWLSESGPVYTKENPNTHWDVSPPLKKVNRSLVGMDGSFGIFKESAHKEAAMKWLDFLARPENIKYYCTQIRPGLALYSPRTDQPISTWQDVDWLKNDPRYTKVIEYDATYGIPYGATGSHWNWNPFFRELYTVLPPHMQQAMRGSRTVKQAMDDAAVEYDAILKTAGWAGVTA